jgi:hypothetical protein
MPSCTPTIAAEHMNIRAEYSANSRDTSRVMWHASSTRQIIGEKLPSYRVVARLRICSR